MSDCLTSGLFDPCLITSLPYPTPPRPCVYSMPLRGLSVNKNVHFESTDLKVTADNPQGGLASSKPNQQVDHRPASKADRTPFQIKNKDPGCTLDGTVEVERAAGKIMVHVIHHDPSRIIFSGTFLSSTKGEMRGGPSGVAGPNVTHRIHDFGFGPSIKGAAGEGRNPLAGSTFLSEHGSGNVKYSLKVVPISHRRMHGAEVKTHTYSANLGFLREEEVIQGMSASGMLLGIEFAYDFTPVMIQYTDTRKSMFEFITSVLAIVGGVYTVSGLLVRGVQGMSREKLD